jgi:glutamyl-Q tRNA(Asp) synthetase
MEDVDISRVQPGAAGGILTTLERFGFEWDGDAMVQSSRTAAYRTAFEVLRNLGVVYGCGCTRKEIADSSMEAAAGPRYPGTCRGGLPPGRSARSWRVRVPSEVISFHDRLQGTQEQNLEEYAGDFIILRADGLFAYQLAVVVDDCEQGVTDVVRGADLLDSTPRQIYLQRLLGAPVPRYLHTPVVVNELGQKLSKQSLARAIDHSSPVDSLVGALTFLGQRPPKELFESDVRTVWSWASANWRPDLIPPYRQAQPITPILPER